MLATAALSVVVGSCLWAWASDGFWETIPLYPCVAAAGTLAGLGLALVSTVNGLRVRSRRGWNMTQLLPELRYLPGGLVLDGELVAWRKGVPYFPLLTRRLLNRDRSIAVTFMAFDLLEIDGRSLLGTRLDARRSPLESLELNSSYWMTPEAFADGPELYGAVCDHGLEGVVAKKRTSLYRPGERGWVKTKNPDYWRRDGEREAMARKHKRRALAHI